MNMTRTFVLRNYQSPRALSPLGDIDGVPFYQTEYEHILKRDDEEYHLIKEWVNNELMPYMTRKSINTTHSSYGLKHVAEKEGAELHPTQLQKIILYEALGLFRT